MNLSCDAGEISRESALSGRLCHSMGSIEISAAELRTFQLSTLLNILFSGEQGVIVIKVDAFSLGVSTGFG